MLLVLLPSMPLQLMLGQHALDIILAHQLDQSLKL
jgi:hypothetical protein